MNIHSYSLRDDDFHFFHIAHNSFKYISTNLIIPRPPSPRKKQRPTITNRNLCTIICYDIGNRVNKTQRKQDIEIFTRHEFVMRRALDHNNSKRCGISSKQPLEIQIYKTKAKKIYPHFFVIIIYIPFNLRLISITIAQTFFCRR